MKRVANRLNGKNLFITIVLCLLQVSLWAQDKTVKINGENIGSWISRNWMWVAGGVILLLLLIGILSGGNRSRPPVIKKTTIVREEGSDGVVRTTTTEIKE
jgi:protein-S-isoprenylcysteine O-methyltransferase Ste14